MGFGRDLRADIFKHVGTFSAQEMGKFGAPSLITRTTNDVQQVQMLSFMGLTMMIAAPITAIGAIIHGSSYERKAFITFISCSASNGHIYYFNIEKNCSTLPYQSAENR
jgi:ABC-type multidrug transport system fused ATPase/permease subunit